MKETRFKNTELGPTNPSKESSCDKYNPLRPWTSKRLGDVCNIYRGGSPRPIDEYLTSDSNGINWIKIGDVSASSKYITKTAEKIKPEGAKFSRAVKIGDFILSNSMSFGRPYIMATDGCIHDGWLVIQDYESVYNIDFLYYILSSDVVFNQYISAAAGSSVKNLNKEKVADVIIVAPEELDEQERIAEALSDVDELIAELGELIEKKRLVKQGAMQQLLTAKRRLPGFSKPWLEKELGKIGITYSGLSGKTKEDFGVGDARYITFLNVLTNPKIRTDLFESVRVGIEEKQNRVEKGDLFFNTSSETPDEVGICSYLDESVSDLYLNSFCFGYRISDPNVFPLYLAYFFRSKIGRDLMSIMAQGVTRYNISKSAFNKASIFIPSDIAEQRAIADMLTDMDNEIAQLEAKREKYRAIKEGMMQQLLTGRIRLIDPTTSSNSTTSVASSNSPDPAPHAPVITYEPTTAYPHSLAAEPKISE